MNKMGADDGSDAVILGAGVAGLAAAHRLKNAGTSIRVIERLPAIGGLARTIDYQGFRFDLGGHRFITHDPLLHQFFTNLLEGRYLIVPRSSKIFLKNQYVRYPLEPTDALSKVGGYEVMRIVRDYVRQKIKYGLKLRAAHSLEEWVISQYGDYLYRLFFKGYSEKVWGIACDKIDKDWIARRIQGLSLARALLAAFFGKSGTRFTTLADKFLYPVRGIGELAAGLSAGLGVYELQLGSTINRIEHDRNRVTAVEIQNRSGVQRIESKHFISTIPLAVLTRLFHPAPPADVLAAVEHLKSRDLIIVTVLLRGERVTKESWIYYPDAQIPFSRIHEPKNWSRAMSPKNTTSLVTEHFSFKGDATWRRTDSQLIDATIKSLCALNLIHRSNVIDAVVVRVPHAYPLFELGYAEHCESVCRYFDRFSNLTVAGRSGSFRYYNLDQAMQSGLDAAQAVLKALGAGLGASVPSENNSTGGISDEMCACYTRVAT